MTKTTIDVANTPAIHVVQAGDTLSKLAQRFYGNAQLYTRIASANNLDPAAILPIGTRLKIPAAQPSQTIDQGDAPVARDLSRTPEETASAGILETVVTTAPRVHWAVYVGAGLAVAGLLYLLFNDNRRRR